MSNLLNSPRAANRATPGIPEKQSCSAHAFLEGCTSDKDSSRRRFLQIATGGTLTSLVTTTGVEFATPHPVLAQSKLSPDAALQELMDGNRRFTSGRLTPHEQDLPTLKHNPIHNHAPSAPLLHTP